MSSHEDVLVVQYARRLWQEAGAILPTDVTSIARTLGLALIYRKYPGSFHGALRYRENGAPYLIINSVHPLARRRYTLAHECAHFLLDRKEISARANRQERTCQLFAANLLLPPDQVRNAAQACYGAYDLLPQLAVQFGVTVSAMRIQLQRLRIIAGYQPTQPSAEELVADAVAQGTLTAVYTVQVPLFCVDVDAIYRSY